MGKIDNLLFGEKFTNKRYLAVIIGVAIVWYAVYSAIIPLSKFLTYDLFSIARDSNLGSSVEFFIYDTLKILLLLVAMVYVIGWVRAAISVERVRNFLMGKNSVFGYFLASLFGAVTPFCSCSSIPIFMAFVVARIPLGVTMSFLITSPMINEVAVVVLWGLLGWKFTVIYVIMGVSIGMIGGFIMDKLRAERWLQPFLLEQMAAQEAIEKSDEGQTKMNWEQRHLFAKQETADILGRVWKWVIIGVGVGAILHGFVPQGWVTDNLGQGQWWSVPLAVLIGIPLYTNVTGIIPIMESLILKGLPIGTTLALCMSTITVSIPELIMLKQVMRVQLLALFVGIMLVIFTLVGWIFNIIAPYIF